MAFLAQAYADNVLIVNGSSVTFEPSTTDDITTNWPVVCTGHTVTVSDTVPASLSGYDQIWDLRFSSTSPLTTADQSAYLAFLQAGKRMFVMGENDGFVTRNDSVNAFVALAGGGALSAVNPAQTQTVNAPFNAGGLTSITWSASGGVTAPGTGIFAANDPSTGGSAIAWGIGTLANAPSGLLTVVYDVNFMQADAPSDQQQFFKNLCTYVTTGGGAIKSVPVPVGGTSAWVLLLAGLGLLGRRALRAMGHG
ncbi:MAG TPA: hypothetical protein VGC24_03330 [Burkholderiaceae bacterium]